MGGEPYFNLHVFLYGLVVTVFMGVRLPASESFCPDWLLYILIGFVVFGLLIELVLEYYKYSTKAKSGVFMHYIFIFPFI